MKHFLILTRCSYSEPGHSSSWIMPFEADCGPADLPGLYRAWMKTKVADEGVNERHYGHKKVIGAFEAIAMPVHSLDSAISDAYADLDADEAATEKAIAERAKTEAAEYAAGVETREREEFARLSVKFAPVSISDDQPVRTFLHPSVRNPFK